MANAVMVGGPTTTVSIGSPRPKSDLEGKRKKRKGRKIIPIVEGLDIPIIRRRQK